MSLFLSTFHYGQLSEIAALAKFSVLRLWWTGNQEGCVQGESFKSLFSLKVRLSGMDYLKDWLCKRSVFRKVILTKVGSFKRSSQIFKESASARTRTKEEKVVIKFLKPLIIFFLGFSVFFGLFRRKIKVKKKNRSQKQKQKTCRADPKDWIFWLLATTEIAT